MQDKLLYKKSGTDLGQITDLFIYNGGHNIHHYLQFLVTSSTGSSATVKHMVMKLVKL